MVIEIIVGAIVAVIIASLAHRKGIKRGEKIGYRRGFGLGRVEGIGIANMTASYHECERSKKSVKKVSKKKK